MRFGGLVAVDDASLDVGDGEIVGLIGTNGAGKSTLMNAIGGFVPVHGHGRAARRRRQRRPAPPRRARTGLGRTFQAATLFPELTVRETVQLALEARRRTGLLSTALFLPRSVTRRAGRGAPRPTSSSTSSGSAATPTTCIADLSTGTRRIVELAGSLALDARVLCLDEPTAGVAQRETEAFGPLIKRDPPRARRDAARHRARHAADHVHQRPRRTASRPAASSPRAIPDRAQRPAVIASYLGTDERAIARSGAVPTAATVPERRMTR